MQKDAQVPFSPTREQKRRPSYAVSSVDNALRMTTWLQLEGTLTVTGRPPASRSTRRPRTG